ncbi:MAG: hypothetical protein BMS9Abin02_0360 [Anaerolineae bacterium]|nr:MAG: hypothetical protein BMS9Abin02_0360 [Anaerolineae bacterium]
MVDITSQVLRDFLNQLARCYRFPGRLYLVGGSSLALAAAKVSTLDIDLQFDVPAEHREAFIHCLRQIGQQSQLSIEQASPDQFIPLPRGYRDRHQFIGRYGSIDVFHFDFYSVALSKLHRGNEKDFADVIEMVRQGLISLDQLRGYFHEVLPQLDSFDISADAIDFERNFSLFEQRLAQN